jgi:hypothetical protein
MASSEGIPPRNDTKPMRLTLCGPARIWITHYPSNGGKILSKTAGQY